LAARVFRERLVVVVVANDLHAHSCGVAVFKYHRLSRSHKDDTSKKGTFTKYRKLFVF